MTAVVLPEVSGVVAGSSSTRKGVSDAPDAAMKSYHAEYGTTISLRQVQSLPTIVAQEHSAVKRITRPRVGGKACEAAQDPLLGIERIHLRKQRQMRGGPEPRASRRPPCAPP